MYKTFFILLSTAGLLAGCANDPVPSEQLRLTEQTITQAKAVGATTESAELALAEQKLSEAGRALAEGDNKVARLLAEQAELDARLAEAQHLNRKSRDQLVELSAHIARLRQQLGEVR